MSAGLGLLRADTVDFLTSMLDVRPSVRLGAHRAREITDHAFVQKYFPSMHDLANKCIAPSFRLDVNTGGITTDAQGYYPEETRRSSALQSGEVRITGSFVAGDHLYSQQICLEHQGDQREQQELSKSLEEEQQQGKESDTSSVDPDHSFMQNRGAGTTTLNLTAIEALIPPGSPVAVTALGDVAVMGGQRGVLKQETAAPSETSHAHFKQFEHMSTELGLYLS